MNNTEATEWIDKARPMVEFIEANGGPRIDEWVCIEIESIAGECIDGLTGKHYDDWACCPPAVVAAICMWIMDVCEHVQRASGWNYVLPRYCQLTMKWHWFLEGKQVEDFDMWQYESDTKELAFLDMLRAICEALGMDGEK